MNAAALTLAASAALCLIASPALASYQTCMTYCMKQHADFDRCHKTCVEAKARPDGASASPGPQKPPKCPKLDQRNDAVFKWVKQHYETSSMLIIPDENDGNVWDVHISLYRENGPHPYCHVNVAVDKHCVVEVIEYVEGDGC